MKKEKTGTNEKKQIYFARTYRHLEFDGMSCGLFMLFFIIPLLILLLIFYQELTRLLSHAAAEFLWHYCGVEPCYLVSDFIPFFGPVHAATAPTVYPESGFTLANLLMTLFLLWFLSIGPWKGRPIPIYLTINLVIHLVACIFFLLGAELFPYQVSDYAELYMKQQVGIWITFLVLIGLVMGILSHGSLFSRVLTVLFLLGYSFLFGAVRYILFLWILVKYSVLYIPAMFFTLGPFFDFLYFVAIYAIATNRMIRKNETAHKEKWAWA